MSVNRYKGHRTTAAIKCHCTICP